MQLSEDLIRNVVQQVLSQMGGPPEAVGGDGPSARNGASTARRSTGAVGQNGVYATADDAVAAARAAFEVFRNRPLADRKKAVACIRTICVENAEELGRKELEETKIGRLDHKIAKLRRDDPGHSGGRVPHRPRSTPGTGA